MKYIREKSRDVYLQGTQVENIFINEYLPAAPGDYVKVYIYASMYAGFDMEMNDQMIARQLGLSEKQVGDAWTYWEKMGAIRKIYFDASGELDFTVEFLDLRQQMYGKNDEPLPAPKRGEEKVFGNEQLKETFGQIEKIMERSMSSTEVRKVISWIVDEHISGDLVLYCFRYCAEKGKTNMRYIETVLHNWVAEGHTSVEEISLHLQETDQRHYQRKRIMQALGFNRGITETEREMIDRWFDEYGFSMERILDACSKTSGISSPNFNYVNKVLLGWRKESESRGTDVNRQVNVTNAQLKQYYEYLRLKGDEEASQRRSEVYASIPRIREIDERYRELGAMMSKALISGRAEEGHEIREQMESLSMERAVLLTDNEYEMDYTDHRYLCEKCHDTGVTDLGERCTCVPVRLEEAEVWLKQQGE